MHNNVFVVFDTLLVREMCILITIKMYYFLIRVATTNNTFLSQS